MQNVSASVTFKYVDPRAREPGPSRQFVNEHIIVPAGGHLPRVGETVELLHWDHNREMNSGLYLVLFAHTRIALYDSNKLPSAWHTTVTVGPLPDDIDSRHITP